MHRLPWILALPCLLLACKPGENNDTTATDPATSAADTTGGGTSGDTSQPTSATGPVDDTTIDPSGDPTGGPSSDPTGSDTTDPPAGPPLFEPDIVPILNASCGSLDNACHARIAYDATVDRDCRGWLALEDAPLGGVHYSGPNEGMPTGCPDMALYDRLLQLDAWQCETFDPRIRYVVPCDPDASYIFRKIAGGPYCSLDMGGQPAPSQPMPMGVVLDPKAIDTIEKWIAAGAPRVDDPGVDCDPGGTSSTGDTGSDSSGTGDPGPQDPVAEIWHPGDGENRPVDVPIPWIGNADDPQEGTLGPDSLVWTSDLEGQFGVGDDFQAPLTVVGTHTITLTATDIDGNQGTAQIVLNIE